MNKREIAFELFRRTFGVNCNPEDHPRAWDNCLAYAQGVLDEEEHLRERSLDEGE